MIYANDNDAKACEWMRQLPLRLDVIDNRSITEVSRDDVYRFTQCHFFAGIGGWPYALSLAQWPDDVPVWTGSCPCQPFSAAGKRKGHSDERHLWPEFYRLIKECMPPVVFGEQVASKLGRSWLSGVRAEMEALGYGFWAADLCAASCGAPHIRQRLFWLGHTEPSRLPIPEPQELRGSRWWQEGATTQQPGTSFWSDREWVHCRDGKDRSVKPGICPLADGIPGRVAQLRGLGNAIVPQVAAIFIRSFIEGLTLCESDLQQQGNDNDQ